MTASTSNFTTMSLSYLRTAAAALVNQLRFFEDAGMSGPYPLDMPGGWEGTAFEAMRDAFGLSSFEQKVLLLAAADELLPTELRERCARDLRLPHPLQAYLTPFSVLGWCDDASIGALRSDAPLLRGGLVRLLPPVDPAASQSLRPLRITAGALEYLMGHGQLPADLSRGLEWLPGEVPLAQEQRSLAGQVCDEVSDQYAVGAPRINLFGDVRGAEDVAAAVGSSLKLPLAVIDLGSVLEEREGAQLDEWVMEWVREATLKGFGLVLRATGTQSTDAEEGAARRSSEAARMRGLLATLQAHLPCAVFLVSREPLAPQGGQRLAAFEVAPPSLPERQSLWAALLQKPLAQFSPSEAGQLDRLIGQFDLPLSRMQAVASEVLARVRGGGEGLLQETWAACRRAGRSEMAQLSDLVEHLPSGAGWEDLILPEDSLETLRDLTLHTTYRAQVQHLMGKSSLRGGSIVALFSGSSGTGKTFAAEVLANALGLDLYRVDLSRLSSKWIGETEKNLSRVFDAADASGVVLLFDEADTVFGKRGDGGDSQGRYANMQTNYLLQRLEAYRGLAILTTNLPGGIDTAFLRRIRFELHFREPDVRERELLWRRAFPTTVPVAGLDYAKFAQVKLTGANIKSSALHAVFVATSRGTAVDQETVEQAVRRELRKLGRYIPELGR